MLSKIDLIGEKEQRDGDYFKKKKWKYFVFQ